MRVAHHDTFCIAVTINSSPCTGYPCLLLRPKLCNMQIYTSDKTSPRSFKGLWYIRFVALVITMIVLGITAANTASFHNIGCDAPARLSYNLAVVCFCPHPSIGCPLTFLASRSSPFSLSSTLSSRPAHPPPPGSFHGSSGAS